MRISSRGFLHFLSSLLVAVLGLGYSAAAQGTSGTIQGTVKDPQGAVIPGAKVEIRDPVTAYSRTTVSDSTGDYKFSNVPFNPYHMVVTAKGFATFTQDVSVRSAVPVAADVTLNLEAAATTVDVQGEASDLIEVDPTAHTDVDRGMFEKLPMQSQSSVSSVVTQASPGVAADSNDQLHGLGDHAENTISVDGQNNTNQVSKTFANSVPMDSVQSLTVVEGAPPAEYGGKTSLVIVATTRSGQGVTTPTGSITTSYGTFGTTNTSFNLAYGGKTWGNFISANGMDSGRFLDAPEFSVMHDKGNAENIFDRIDYQFSEPDSIHINLNYSRSWFQNPNSFDQEFHFGLTDPITGAPLGPSDQRAKINTFNIAPTWNHLFGANAVFTFGAFVHKDQYNYYPSANPFDDYSPDLQSETLAQSRSLLNTGLRSDYSATKGINNIKVGAIYQQTFVTEGDTIGIVDPTLEPGLGCLSPTGVPTGPPCTVLAPSDLTLGGSLFNFHGHADIKETGLYVQDTINKGSWTFNVGVRGDIYRGLSSGDQAEPRAGISYNIKPSNTVLRLSYARTMESPFNENLVIASTGCSIPFLAALVPPAGVPCVGGPIQPGYRNEFHAGFEQAFGKHFVLDGEYLWKYTHNAYDFGVVGNTPLAFPIEWHNSKIPGFTLRARIPETHGFSAYVTMSHVSARFFLPQTAGLPIVPPATGVFRIDHDEVFNETTHLQYQPWKRGPWLGFDWRFDSGLVAGSTPCYNPLTTTCAGSSTLLNGQPAIAMINTATGLPLTADQEFQAGFTCNGAVATPTTPLPFICPANQFGSTLISVPAPGTENDDHNPQRIAPRNLFNLTLGDDDLFHTEKYKWSAQFSVINLTNKVALYNFLSTFSGTHYVSPRTLTAELGFHF
jgi:hypothetical protein